VTTAAGDVTSSIVGDYLTNMTFTGAVVDLGSGETQKTYSYSPLNALVNIVTNAARQVISAVVLKATSTTSSASSSATVIVSTAAARRRM
jgi:CO/xanthine dehydrogenase FAD-binding subunit